MIWKKIFIHNEMEFWLLPSPPFFSFDYHIPHHWQLYINSLFNPMIGNILNIIETYPSCYYCFTVWIQELEKEEKKFKKGEEVRNFLQEKIFFLYWPFGFGESGRQQQRRLRWVLVVILFLSSGGFFFCCSLCALYYFPLWQTSMIMVKCIGVWVCCASH